MLRGSWPPWPLVIAPLSVIALMFSQTGTNVLPSTWFVVKPEGGQQCIFDYFRLFLRGQCKLGGGWEAPEGVKPPTPRQIEHWYYPRWKKAQMSPVPRSSLIEKRFRLRLEPGQPGWKSEVIAIILQRMMMMMMNPFIHMKEDKTKCL